MVLKSLEELPGLQEVLEELKSSAVFLDILTKYYRAFSLV